jgi:hypothetical protein
MFDFVDGTAFNNEQGNRARKLFAAVVLAALDDAIADDKKYGNGPEQIARWARSRDGREVLTCAGIDPNERVVKGLMEFVGKGVRTSVALGWTRPFSFSEEQRPHHNRRQLEGEDNGDQAAGQGILETPPEQHEEREAGNRLQSPHRAAVMVAVPVA